VQLTLYKEVDGLMTADPKSVPAARVAAELHYREAAELAYYGAKVLHPRTMIPLAEPQDPAPRAQTHSRRCRHAHRRRREAGRVSRPGTHGHHNRPWWPSKAAA